MRLIDADELKKALSKEKTKPGTPYFLGKSVYEAIENAPTIEAEPVRHGFWKIKTINTFELAYGSTGYEPVYECSVCGKVEESYLRLDEPIMPEDADFPNYCPNCGALMDYDEWLASKDR